MHIHIRTLRAATVAANHAIVTDGDGFTYTVDGDDAAENARRLVVAIRNDTEEFGSDDTFDEDVVVEYLDRTLDEMEAR